MASATDIYVMSDNKLKSFLFRRQSYTGSDSLELRAYDEYLKLLRVRSGSGTWQIEKREYPLQKDDILILNNTERRRLILPAEAKEPLVLEYVQFLPTMLYPNQQCILPFFFRPPNFSNKLDRENEHHAMLLSLFDRMAEECEATRPYKDECIYALLLQMIVCLGREYEAADTDKNAKQYGSVRNYEIIAEAVRYITQYPYEDLSVDAMAKKFYVSKCYFSHLFKFYNGMSFLTYVKICRVNYAIRLINEKDMSIADAAFSSGFGCVSGFYKAVKDVTGMPPGKVVKQIRSE